MNNIVSTFFFSLIFLIFIIGVIYTLYNNSKLKRLLIKEKILYNLNALEIFNLELVNGSYMIGNMTIYENYIRLESTTFSHTIISHKNTNSSIKTGSIMLNECLLEDDKKIKLIGVKSRFLYNSSIAISIRSENKAGLKKINKLVNTYFLH